MAGELVPRKITREQLERIIQRAAELQAGEMETGDGLTEQELLKLGSDVGIPGKFLRQALYEENLGGTALERSLASRWVGPRMVLAHRVVPGDRAALEQALGEYMAEEEAMTPKRRLPDRTLWEAQKGFFAEMKRGFGVGGKSYHLARAAEVSVAVTPLEEGYCHVALTADVSNSRRDVVSGASVTAGTGVVISAILLSVVPAAVPLVLLLPAALGLGIGASIPRAHRRKAARVQLALEQVLDGLERGEIRPRPAMPGPRASAFVRIADEIKRSLVDVAEAARQVPPPRKPPTLPRGKD